MLQDKCGGNIHVLEISVCGVSPFHMHYAYNGYQTLIAAHRGQPQKRYSKMTTILNKINQAKYTYL